jgi:hypothetical protein
MTTKPDWIKLNVIASFDNNEQDIFDMFVSPKENATEEDLLKSIMSNLEHSKEDLYKLSLCWICGEDIVKKYNFVKESIDKNAKYFFEKGELIK